MNLFACRLKFSILSFWQPALQMTAFFFKNIDFVWKCHAVLVNLCFNVNKKSNFQKVLAFFGISNFRYIFFYHEAASRSSK